MVVHLTLVRVLKGLYGKRLALRHGKALQSSVTSWNKTSLTHTARMTPAAVVHPCPQTTQGGKGAKPNQPHTVRSLSGLEGGVGGGGHQRYIFGKNSSVFSLGGKAQLSITHTL